jgi:hypothetical protein
MSRGDARAFPLFRLDDREQPRADGQLNTCGNFCANAIGQRNDVVGVRARKPRADQFLEVLGKRPDERDFFNVL